MEELQNGDSQFKKSITSSSYRAPSKMQQKPSYQHSMNNSIAIKEESDSDSLNSSLDNSERVYESPKASLVTTAVKHRRHHSNKSVPHAKDSSNSLKNIHLGS